MFLFILFITYAFHYLFVKTGRAMPALARRRWQSCSRAAVPRTQPRRHGRGQDPESGLCGGHGGRRARAGPAAQAPRPASLSQRQSPSFVFLAATGSCFAPCPAPAPWGRTSHSMQPPGGAPPHRLRSKRRARHSGAGPDPRLRFLPRAASCHSPITPSRSPTLRDSARHAAGPHSRTPTPSSCAVFLPAPSSSRCLGACVGHGLNGDVPVMVLAAMAR